VLAELQSKMAASRVNNPEKERGLHFSSEPAKNPQTVVTN